MKVNKYHFSRLIGGSATSWEDLPPLTRGAGERSTLLRYSPQVRPGLGLTIWVNTSKEKLFKHLLAKWTVSGFLRKSETLIGAMLLLGLRSPYAEILDFIISYKIRTNAKRSDLWKELHQLKIGLPNLPKQYLKAFEPEIFIQREYYPKLKIPAKRYIGIGYSDYGHLSTTPA